MLLERNPGSTTTGKRLLLARPAADVKTLTQGADLLLLVKCPCWARLEIMPALSTVSYSHKARHMKWPSAGCFGARSSFEGYSPVDQVKRHTIVRQNCVLSYPMSKQRPCQPHCSQAHAGYLKQQYGSSIATATAQLQLQRAPQPSSCMQQEAEISNIYQAYKHSISCCSWCRRCRGRWRLAAKQQQ